MKPISWAILALVLAGCARSGSPAPVVDRTLTYDGIFAVASRAATNVGERVADGVARVVAEVRQDAAPPPAIAAPRESVIVEPLDIDVAAGPAASPVASPPPAAVAAPALSTYRVAKGDTVYSIARRHGVDAKTIMALNDLAPPYKLRIDDRLRLPGTSAAPAVTFVSTAPVAPVTPVAPLTPVATLQPVAVSLPAPKANARPLPQTRAQLNPSPPVILASAGPVPRVRPQPPRRLAAADGPVGAPPPRAGGAFAWPVTGPVVAAYGALDGGRFNDGVNIGAPRGTPVVAAENAVVVYAGNEIRGFGNLVLLKHDGGIITAYAHNDALLVRRGDMVGKGDTIARVGRSGGVAEPQLHFEIRRGKRAVDPNTMLAQPELAAR